MAARRVRPCGGEANGRGGQRGRRKPYRDRAATGPMYRCKYPREFHALSATSICGGLTFADAREQHLRECHDVSVGVVDELFEKVATDETSDRGKYGKQANWCWCGTRKPPELDCCPACHERDKYDRANRVMSTVREGERSGAGEQMFSYRERWRREGLCVGGGHGPPIEGLLFCQTCLDKAAERKRLAKLRKTGGSGT